MANNQIYEDPDSGTSAAVPLSSRRQHGGLQVRSAASNVHHTSSIPADDLRKGVYILPSAALLQGIQPVLAVPRTDIPIFQPSRSGPASVIVTSGVPIYTPTDSLQSLSISAPRPPFVFPALYLCKNGQPSLSSTQAIKGAPTAPQQAWSTGLVDVSRPAVRAPIDKENLVLPSFGVLSSTLGNSSSASQHLVYSGAATQVTFASSGADTGTGTICSLESSAAILESSSGIGASTQVVQKPEPTASMASGGGSTAADSQMNESFVMADLDPSPIADEFARDDHPGEDLNLTSVEMAGSEIPSELTLAETRSAYAPPESTAIARQPLMTMVQQTAFEPVEPLNSAAVRLLDEEYFYMPQHLQQQYWQMRLREEDYRQHFRPNYFDYQPELVPSHRSVLVDWMVEVAEHFRITRQTLHMAVGYVDRFLSACTLKRSKLQLVGATALYLAAKVEEVTIRDASDYADFTDNAYSPEEILSTECALLKKLDYDLWPVTAKNMVELYLFFVTQPDRADVALQVGHRQCYEFAQDAAHRPSSSYLHPNDERCPRRNANVLKETSMYLSELVLVAGRRFLHYLPNEIAASAVYLAILTHEGTKFWPPILERRTDISLNHFADCLVDMHELLLEAWSARNLWDNNYGTGNFLTPDDSASSLLDPSENVGQLANQYPNPRLNPHGNVRQPYATGIELHAVAVKYSKSRYLLLEFDDFYARVSLKEPPISLPSFVHDAYHVAVSRRSRLERGRDFLKANHKQSSQQLDLHLAARRDSAPAQQPPPQLLQQKLLQQQLRHESMEVELVEQVENEVPSDTEPSRSAVSNSSSSSRSSSSSGSKRTLGFSEEEMKHERAVSKRSRGGASHPLSSRDGDSNRSIGRRQK